MVGRQHGVCRKSCRENVVTIVEKVVPIGDHNPADGLLAEFSNLGKLGGQPLDAKYSVPPVRSISRSLTLWMAR